MSNQPSGPGPTTKANSLSVTSATDDPGNLAEQSIDADLDSVKTSLASIDTKLSSQATATKQDTLDTDVKRLSPIGPGPGSATPSASKVFGFAFTANTAANFDLTGAAYTGLKTAIDAGKGLTLKSTTGCYYNWATGNITIAAASTAASNPATQGVPMFDGERSDERAPSGTTVLNILGGALAGTLYAVIAE